jgi:hypothetical protein
MVMCVSSQSSTSSINSRRLVIIPMDDTIDIFSNEWTSHNLHRGEEEKVLMMMH